MLMADPEISDYAPFLLNMSASLSMWSCLKPLCWTLSNGNGVDAVEVSYSQQMGWVKLQGLRMYIEDLI